MIGNVIGEENAGLGKQLCLMTVIYSTAISGSIGLISHTYSDEIASAYTQDEEMIE